MRVFMGKTARFQAEFRKPIFLIDLHLDAFGARGYFRGQLKHCIEQSRSSATAFLLLRFENRRDYETI